MSANSFEDKLKDLKLTNDEIKRFSDAFKNEEFRKLFMEYAEELNDPKNRELYEQEIRAVEEQRGSDVTFIHPKPGHVLKTTTNGKQKCFINIATNEHVEKPNFTKTDPATGQQGAHWSLPHCLAGPHEDIDHESKSCTVYDVIFSPDTYRMAETNSKFMKMVEDSALESVEKNYQCKLDRNNVKRPKINFKGVPKATIIRKKKEQSEDASNQPEIKPETDDIIDKAISAAQNHKVVLSSHNRPANGTSSKPLDPTPDNTLKTDENGFTIPNYRIVHRGEIDMQDCTNNILPQVRSLRPKELLVEIELPLCASSNNVDLDVCERTLKLHCDSPKYSLDLALPFPVRENESHARFDKKHRKLIVTLAVLKETLTVIEPSSDIEMEQQTIEDIEQTSPTSNSQIVPSNEIIPMKTYSPIPFDYKQGQAHLALVLYVKNIDQTSFKIDNDGQCVTIQLSSMGSGCFPLHHQLCLDFEEPMVFECTDTSTTTKFNEDNILVLLKKTVPQKTLNQFFSGISREDMKFHQCSNLTLNNKKDSTIQNNDVVEESRIKNEFQSGHSSSSTSTSTDSKKKLSKKQAKRQAKKNSKNNNANEHDQEQIVQDLTDANIKSDPEEDHERIRTRKMEHSLSDTSNVRNHSTLYRRHVSESHADLEPSSNGEFKLKGILKNATKYRSHSESHSEAPSDNMHGDFVREESVFEACSTTDDLTSSNENNSIVTSNDSNGIHGGSSSLCSTPGSAPPVKHVTFNTQVSRKTFKPGGPVSGMRKLSVNQQRKLKKRRRQDSLNSQSSDQDDQAPPSAPEKSKAKSSDDYKNPVEFQDVISWQASASSTHGASGYGNESSASQSAVRFTNGLIFELED